MPKIIKKTLSCGVGVPAGIVAVSECEDLRLWWVPFVALGVVIAILAWNGAFKKEEAKW